jgi:DNA-binding MurR/RpiR family transcriptional regulator
MSMHPEAPLFEQLQQGLHELPRNQRVLAKYVMSHYQGVAFANVKELAGLSGVSEATIVRFAKALGFSGYPSFQKEIRRIVRADLKGTERFELADPSVKGGTKLARSATSSGRGPRQPADSALAPVIRKELENISQLNELHDPRAFSAALAALRGASEVVSVGSRSAASIAHHLWFGLSKIGVRVTRVMAITTDTYDFLNGLDRKACVFLISFPRHLKETLALSAFLRRRGMRTVCITDSPFSPLRGKVNLYAPAESASFIGFHCAPLILVNALLHELSLTDKKRTLGALNRFESLAEAEGYFSKD